MEWSSVSRRRLGVHLLRVVGAGADDVVGVVGGVDHHPLDVVGVRHLLAHAEGEVDQRLALVLGRVLLGVAVHDGALGLAGRGQRHLVVGGVVYGSAALAVGLGAAGQHPADDAVLALVDRGRRAFAAHGAVHGLDRQLAGMGGGVGLPGGDLALAGLAEGDRDVQRLLHRLVDRLLLQAEQRADAGGGGGAEMGDVVHLVLVQADGADQVDLDLVGGGERRGAGRGRSARWSGRRRGRAGCCRRGGSSRRRGRCRACRARAPPCRSPRPPIRGRSAWRPGTPNTVAPPFRGMAERHGAGGDDGAAVDRGDGDRGVVDDPVDDHLRHVLLDRHRSAATPAIFQASCSSRGSSALEGWTLTWCICMAGGVPLSLLRCVRRGGWWLSVPPAAFRPPSGSRVGRTHLRGGDRFRDAAAAADPHFGDAALAVALQPRFLAVAAEAARRARRGRDPRREPRSRSRPSAG